MLGILFLTYFITTVHYANIKDDSNCEIKVQKRVLQKT